MVLPQVVKDLVALIKSQLTVDKKKVVSKKALDAMHPEAFLITGNIAVNHLIPNYPAAEFGMTEEVLEYLSGDTAAWTQRGTVNRFAHTRSGDVKVRAQRKWFQGSRRTGAFGKKPTSAPSASRPGAYDPNAGNQANPLYLEKPCCTPSETARLRLQSWVCSGLELSGRN